MAITLYEYYVSTAQLLMATTLLAVVIGYPMLLREQKLPGTLKGVVVWSAVTALGMSSDIKHLSFIGLMHAAVAWGIIAWHIQQSPIMLARVLLVPGVLIVVVLLFNVYHTDVGLELFGRWAH